MARLVECMRKKRFADSAAAVDACRQILSKPSRDVSKLRVYECRFCKGWHMTSKA